MTLFVEPFKQTFRNIYGMALGLEGQNGPGDLESIEPLLVQTAIYWDTPSACRRGG